MSLSDNAGGRDALTGYSKAIEIVKHYFPPKYNNRRKSPSPCMQLLARINLKMSTVYFVVSGRCQGQRGMWARSVSPMLEGGGPGAWFRQKTDHRPVRKDPVFASFCS